MARILITTVVVLSFCFLLTPDSVEAEEKGWKEAETGYPVRPKTKSLLLVETPPQIKPKVYIDPENIKILR
ncbi:MAG: hypothetical protein BMS9Abin11_1423 [Gammaproteobacteria bacterium]|nr:MAG: hypothetical protein BMS9Abin11_1423 [Gammaproteobacteria bacterium]